jgi:hypothetical protein
MLVAHEAPLKIMRRVREQTDYCYCLVHLLEESKEYRDFFFESKKMGRKIILDNSLYELGEAYNHDLFFNWVLQLEPDEYIIPDVFQDYEANIKSFEQFLGKFDTHSARGKRIGVIQGKNYQELKDSYLFMSQHADKIAISFGYDYFWQQALENCEDSIYKTIINNPLKNEKKVKEVWKPTAFATFRPKLLKQLIDDGVIDYTKSHHLLGCGLPTEFINYTGDLYSFIETIDTSHPVLMGYNLKSYEYTVNLEHKIVEKMVDIFDKKISDVQLECIEENINFFKQNILCK